MAARMQETERVRRGVIEGRADAVETVRGWIAAMVYGAGWRLADPESAIQDVVARIIDLAARGRIRDDTDFKSFVLTVARHGCTDQFRRERLRARHETSAPPPAAGVADAGAAPGNPESVLAHKERREMLRFIFQALPEECRRLWRWVYGQGLAAAEVAERLGISVVNVRVRVHRCLKKAQEIRGREFGAAGAGGVGGA